MADIFDLFKQISKAGTDSDKKNNGQIEFIVVGLGNPGDKYMYTRHNVGFIAIDYMVQARSFDCKKLKFKALTGECVFDGHRALVMKPQTFMNLSGEAVAEAAAFYKISSEKIIVIYDDISIDVGRMRVRRDGSDGGHNGIKSITANLGSDKYPRIKIGVGKKPHPDMDLADWVLSGLNEFDKKIIFNGLSTIVECVDMLVSDKIDDAMGKFNGINFQA